VRGDSGSLAHSDAGESAPQGRSQIVCDQPGEEDHAGGHDEVLGDSDPQQIAICGLIHGMPER